MNLAGKTVFVTGAGGFIGSHLVEVLLEAGATVRALLRYNSFDHLGWLKSLAVASPRLQITRGDIRDRGAVERLVENCDIGFHLASLISVPYSYEAPEAYLQTNVQGALNVFEACRRFAIARLVHLSTSEVYGSAQYTPIDEQHPLNAQSPYAASKIAADALAHSYHCSFGLPVITIRPFNTFGPRQSPRAVIPSILAQVLFSKTNRLLLGVRHTTRDFTFVSDITAGLLAAALAERSWDGRTIQLGCGDPKSIEEIARLAMTIAGRQLELVLDEQRLRPPLSEVQNLHCKNQLAHEALGWRPRCSFEEGLQQTLAWWRENPEAYRWQGYSL